jgi:hypothetical protein
MIDWSLLVIKLRRHYKPVSTFAKEVGSDWQHLNRIARGETAEPKFSVGMKLLDLAYDHLPEHVFQKLNLSGGIHEHRRNPFAREDLGGSAAEEGCGGFSGPEGSRANCNGQDQGFARSNAL